MDRLRTYIGCEKSCGREAHYSFIDAKGTEHLLCEECYQRAVEGEDKPETEKEA